MWTVNITNHNLELFLNIYGSLRTQILSKLLVTNSHLRWHILNLKSVSRTVIIKEYNIGYNQKQKVPWIHLLFSILRRIHGFNHGTNNYHVMHLILYVTKVSD